MTTGLLLISGILMYVFSLKSSTGSIKFNTHDDLIFYRYCGVRIYMLCTAETRKILIRNRCSINYVFARIDLWLFVNPLYL